MNFLQQLEQLQFIEFAVAHLVSWGHFLSDDTGQDLVEYALVAALLALASITTVRDLGNKISTSFSSIATNLTSDT